MLVCVVYGVVGELVVGYVWLEEVVVVVGVLCDSDEFCCFYFLDVFE